MSETHFLPWMRLGLAAGLEGNGTTGAAATIQPSVDVVVHDGGHNVPGPQIQLRGPGDVIALNPTTIKRRDPEAGATGAETSYFCSVELFPPDLPWRYTPTAVDADGHLQPWLVLVVVELGPGVTLSTGGRLPVLSVDSPSDHLPDLADSWAWAHVQAATSLDGGVATAYATDPEAFTSRLLCPRRLGADTPYTACIVPAFRSGREAGLGLAPGASNDPAWGDGPVELPVYDSWELTAGDRYDFKTLARRIKPAELPDDVGFRDLDLTDAGTGIRPITTPATFVGAMHAPTDGLVYWHDQGNQRQFEHDVRQRLVATPTPPTSGRSAYDPLVDDPVVAPTVHGAPQVGSAVVPESAPGKRGWFEELNVSPHHRAVAGLGAEVVRADQEALMAAAWEQARPVLDVNRRLNRGRLGQEVARQAERKWRQLDDATAVSVAAPAFVSMRVDGTTAKQMVADGDAPSAYFGAAFRRLGRAKGPLSTSAGVPAARSPALEIARAAIESARAGADGAGRDPLSIGFRIRYLPPGMDVGGPLVVAGSTVDPQATRRDRLTQPDATGQRPRRRAERTAPVGALTDGINLDPFQFEVVRPVVKGRIITTAPGPGQLGVDLASTVRAAVRPVTGIADSVRSQVLVPLEVWESASIPTRVGLQPRFTDPMYERVRALSVDYLVPGVGAVPNNILGLLEINPAYVEAFLVGLNHEMSRELRWREYPAALDQTWFQHFFDNVDPANPPDVGAIDTWAATASLGHEYGGGTTPGLVLLIKADLIRKYPDVRVYAVPAQMNDDGERVPMDGAAPSSPTFVGTLQRGVNFYGFEDLTEEEARGDGAGNDGWFFVLEEEPRAMRFGLDRGTASGKGELPASTWANLAWANLAVDDAEVPWFCTIDPPNPAFDGAARDDLEWGRDAAVMAAITFRQPVQVFMHASAMLPGGTG